MNRSVIIKIKFAMQKNINNQLCVSTLHNDFDGARAALESGADPNAKYTLILQEEDYSFSDPDSFLCIDNGNALMLAAALDRGEFVDLFLPLTDAHQADSNGKTALMFASEMSACQCIRRLAKASDIHAVDNEGRSALEYAAFAGFEAIESLLSIQEVTFCQDEIDNALLCAIAGDDEDTALLLLSVLRNERYPISLASAVESATRMGSRKVARTLGMIAAHIEDRAAIQTATGPVTYVKRRSL